MERKVKSFRLRTDLLEWVKSYAATRGSTEVAVLELALSSLKRDAEGGVLDLPTPESLIIRASEVRSRAPQAKREETADDWNMARQRKLNEAKYR